MTRKWASTCARGGKWALVFVCATLGCASQPEGGMPADADADRWDEAAAEPAGAPATASEPPASMGEAARDLDQMQRELAANEAKLRALGVALPSAGGGQAEQADKNTEVRRDGPSEKKPSEATPQPGTSPSDEDAGVKNEKRKQSKRDRERETKTPQPNKLQPNKPPTMDEAERPDQAKAAPLSPNTGSPEQDAAGRCSMICELSQITCELNTQICELADRHPQEDDYRSACDRAAEDCEVAQEACHACVG